MPQSANGAESKVQASKPTEQNTFKSFPHSLHPSLLSCMFEAVLCHRPIRCYCNCFAIATKIRQAATQASKAARMKTEPLVALPSSDRWPVTINVQSSPVQSSDCLHGNLRHLLLLLRRRGEDEKDALAHSFICSTPPPLL